MRLKSIWSIPSLTLIERLRRTADWSAMTTAAKLPRRVRYWATILEISKATVDSPNIPATPLDEILKNLPSGPK